MDEKMKDLLLRLGAGGFTALGVIAVLLGYLGVRDEANIELQIPYLFSGGLGGLALVGVGALCLIQLQMRQQTRNIARITDELDEWKDAALHELRAFLASAVVEIDLDVEEEPAEIIRRQHTSRGRGSSNGTSPSRTKPMRAS